MNVQGFRRINLGPLAEEVNATLEALVAADAIERLWARDHTLWNPDPTEIADRLGWLEVTADMTDARDRLDGVVAAARADGLTHLVVMGMGGSSLFPEVIAQTFGGSRDGLELMVLDSTDPDAVARVAATAPEGRTLYLASSKSGGTVETRSHLEFFWERVADPTRFAVVTDPGSELASLARERGFREVFENRTDIGGRYSALSYFGLVPAALTGMDWFSLVRSAQEIEPALRSSDRSSNPALVLGAVMAAGVRSGRDKLTLAVDPRVETFGLWLEQLLAESTGKGGTGVIPVVGEALGPIDVYGTDRLFVGLGEVEHPVGLDVLAEEGHPVVELEFGEPLGLGAQVLLWEVATAVCGSSLGLNPFDQPNVAEAKEATNQVLSEGAHEVRLLSLEDLLGEVGAGDYIAIQAYMDPWDPDAARLEEARLGLRDEFKVATTFGFGPRFLHSTGQLHKGGPPSGVFVQVVGDDPSDAAIPGRDFTFAELKRAQADGDLATLLAHGLRASRVSAAELIAHSER